MKNTFGFAAMVAVLCTGAASSASADFNYSDWASKVWPVSAEVIAVAGLATSDITGATIADGLWQDTQTMIGVRGAPGGNTWMRVRVRCYASSSLTGGFRTVRSDWAPPSNSKPHPQVSCPTNSPFPSQPQVQVASEGYATFFYLN